MSLEYLTLIIAAINFRICRLSQTPRWDIVLVPDQSSNRQLKQADFKTRSGLGLPGGQTWTVRAAVIRDSTNWLNALIVLFEITTIGKLLCKS